MPFVLPTSTPTDSTSPFRSGTASRRDRKSTRLNSSHLVISYAVFCLKKKNASIVVTVNDDHMLIEHAARHPAFAYFLVADVVDYRFPARLARTWLTPSHYVMS